MPIVDKCVTTTVRKVRKSKSKHVPKQILSVGVIVPVKKFQKDEKLEECQWHYGEGKKILMVKVRGVKLNIHVDILWR